MRFTYDEVLQACLRKAQEANRITFEYTNKKSVLETLGLLEGDYLLNAGAASLAKVDNRVHDEVHVDEYDDTLNVEENILKFCTIARSRAEIIEFCGLKSRAQFTTRYLMPLIESNKLAMTIPDKPKSKKQKYLTI